MNINICLWNWKDYNDGIDNWKWFALPEDTENMYEWIEILNNEGKEEVFICDSENSFITESTSIEGLIALSYCDYDEITELASYEPAFQIEMLDEMLEGYSPTKIINMIHFGNYSPLDDYFMFDGNYNIKTLSNYEYDEHMEDAFNEGAEEFLRNY